VRFKAGEVDLDNLIVDSFGIRAEEVLSHWCRGDFLGCLCNGPATSGLEIWDVRMEEGEEGRCCAHLSSHIANGCGTCSAQRLYARTEVFDNVAGSALSLLSALISSLQDRRLHTRTVS
jgi:hypothetical protein